MDWQHPVPGPGPKKNPAYWYQTPEFAGHLLTAEALTPQLPPIRPVISLREREIPA